MFNICSIEKTNKQIKTVLIDVKYFPLWCWFFFSIIISPKDLSIKSTRQNTKRDKSKMIPLVHGTQPMKRSTPRSTQSICLPDTRWRKTLLQTQSDVIPPIQFVRKTHWWINLTVHLCPFGKADPFVQLYCTNIHQYTYTFYNQYSSFYFDKRIVSQTGVHIETILFIFNTGFIPV